MVGRRENQGLDNSQGWEEEKTKGWIIAKGGKKRKPRAVIKAKGGKSNTSPNNHPGGCIRQVRVRLPLKVALRWRLWPLGRGKTLT